MLLFHSVYQYVVVDVQIYIHSQHDYTCYEHTRDTLQVLASSDLWQAVGLYHHQLHHLRD
jgi:hypothetical protein